MKVRDVRCYPTHPEEEGAPPIVTVAIRVGEMYFSFRLPLALAWVAYGRLGEALTKISRVASKARQGEGGKESEPEAEGKDSQAH